MKQGVILFLLGLVGILSSVPLIPQLLALQPEKAPIPMYAIQLLSVLQASVLLIGMVILGSFFAHRTNLYSPVTKAIAQGGDALGEIRKIATPAIFGGVAGGIGILAFARAFLGHLPREFLESAKGFSPPWYTRILYGGITEEILVRWGLMSFLVWCCFRLTQKSDTGIRSSNYVIAIVLSALIFGAAHLPVASLLSPVLTFQLIIYIILGNAIFGIIAGFLYWRRGLECAILAHVLAHITMLAGEALA